MDRRVEPRMLCADLVDIRWKDQAGRTRHIVANLEDISLSGICLQVESPIPAGTDIAMHYGDGQLVGTIRYCRYQGMGYFLGVELAEGCRWSSQHYRPQHLLDPSELVDQAMQRHRSVSSQVH